MGWWEQVLVTHRVRGGWVHCTSSALPAPCVAAAPGGKAGGAGTTVVRKGYIGQEHLQLSPLPRPASWAGGATLKLGDFGGL